MTLTRSTLYRCVLILLLAACSTDGPGGSDAPEFRTRVKTAEVARADVERTLELTGTIEAGRAVNLLPTSPGKIAAIPVKVGQRVKKGDVLARMDLDIPSLQLDQARAAVRLAELGLETNQKDFARIQALNERGSVTPQQFDQAAAGLEMADLQVAQAKAAAGLARESVDGGVLVAPFDGVVSIVGGEEGDWYNPMTANPMAGPAGLVGVVDLSSVRIDLDVAESDVGKVEPGMGAHVLVDALSDRLPVEGIPGSVDSVGLAADATTRTFPVRVVAANPDMVVRAGMAGRVRLELERRPDVVAVPISAVLTDATGSYVLTVADGTVRRVPVQTGLVGRKQIEVLSGLSGGEQVVVDGSFGLPDGTPVEVVP